MKLATRTSNDKGIRTALILPVNEKLNIGIKVNNLWVGKGIDDKPDYIRASNLEQYKEYAPEMAFEIVNYVSGQRDYNLESVFAKVLLAKHQATSEASKGDVDAWIKSFQSA